MVRVNDITQIPARDDAGHRQVFHHYLPDRRSQTRGVTAFAPMADTADHWDDLGTVIPDETLARTCLTGLARFRFSPDVIG